MSKSVTLLNGLRIGFSHLREHKFRHNFQDVIEQKNITYCYVRSIVCLERPFLITSRKKIYTLVVPTLYFYLGKAIMVPKLI